MSRRRKKSGRNVNGVLLLDKPSGWTSNQVLQKVKYLYQASKAGHTGSLDKPATGLLPICLGEATKFSSALLDADKHYRTRVKLGEITTTGDAAGESVEKRAVPEFDEPKLEDVLENLRGNIQQVPPMYSALKQNGTRLYQLAYQGVEVERPPRAVSIYSLNLCDFGKDWLDLDIHCSKGTYIRSLAVDIGSRLGCGAHVEVLRRLGSGPYKAQDMIDLPGLEKLAELGTEQLDDALLAVDSALLDLPSASLDDALVQLVRQGQPVTASGTPKSGKLRIYDSRQRFLGLAEVQQDGRIAPRRLLSAINS